MQERLYDWLESFSLSGRSALVGIFVCLVSISFYVLVAQPRSQQIAGLREDLFQLDGDLQQESKNAARLQEMIAKNEQWQVAWQETQPFLAKESEITFLLSQISDLAIRMGLNVTSWKPGEPNQDSSRRIVQIPVTVQLVRWLSHRRHVP